MTDPFDSPASLGEALRAVDYLPDARISQVGFLAHRLGKPVLVEGPAGVGKTELSKALAVVAGRPLIRLQCYEGLDESRALYEWNYKKQLLRIQADRDHDWEKIEGDIFSEEFLLARPLLAAIMSPEPVVLLIDEIDRVELETEALLLEVLSDFQVSIPELGTVRASSRPLVLLTSNNTRELSEALKRRCLFLHISYPSPERERDILLARVPDLPTTARRGDRPGGAERAGPGSQEGTVGLRDARLGQDAPRPRNRARRRRGARRDRPRPPQVPVRHRSGPPGARRPGMIGFLASFVEELRRAGLPVSLVETIDAMDALAHVDLSDRDGFRETLRATLVKNERHHGAFDVAFDVFFASRVPVG